MDYDKTVEIKTFSDLKSYFSSMTPSELGRVQKCVNETLENKKYTEKEIKQWFDKMKKKYPNSGILQHLEAVEYMMFSKVFDDSDCLEKIKEGG